MPISPIEKSIDEEGLSPNGATRGDQEQEDMGEEREKEGDEEAGKENEEEECDGGRAAVGRKSPKGPTKAEQRRA